MTPDSPRRFVRSAPVKADKTRSVDIRITDMSESDAAWWDARLGPWHLRIATRADRFWPWTLLLPVCHLVQLRKGRVCRPLVIWARADNGRFVRSGMSILIENYPYLDVAHLGASNFVWFMSAADPAVLAANFAVSNAPALGRVLLDNAIVLGQNAGFDGKIGLHAAAAGGEALLAMYENCGLTRLPATATLPQPIGRNNDRRYFYADEIVAESLAGLLDAHR
jgi:hypothetical protein